MKKKSRRPSVRPSVVRPCSLHVIDSNSKLLSVTEPRLDSFPSLQLPMSEQGRRTRTDGGDESGAVRCPSFKGYGRLNSTCRECPVSSCSGSLISLIIHRRRGSVFFPCTVSMSIAMALLRRRTNAYNSTKQQIRLLFSASRASDLKMGPLFAAEINSR